MSATPAFIEKLRAGAALHIVFYGTSLTAGGGWTGPLSEKLEATFPGQLRFTNTAVGGKESVWGLANFEELVLAHRPDVLFMEFCVNDAVDRFHISADTAEANLEAMLGQLRQRFPDCEVILQLMNPVIDRPAGHDGARTLLAEHQQRWRDVAARRGLRIIDHMPAWTALLESDEAKFREFVTDGLHPSRAGYEEVMLPVLLRELGLN